MQTIRNRGHPQTVRTPLISQLGHRTQVELFQSRNATYSLTTVIFELVRAKLGVSKPRSVCKGDASLSEARRAAQNANGIVVVSGQQLRIYVACQTCSCRDLAVGAYRH